QVAGLVRRCAPDPGDRQGTGPRQIREGRVGVKAAEGETGGGELAAMGPAALAAAAAGDRPRGHRREDADSDEDQETPGEAAASHPSLIAHLNPAGAVAEAGCSSTAARCFAAAAAAVSTAAGCSAAAAG